MFQRLEPVDHGFDLGACFLVLRDQGGALGHEGFLPGLQRHVFLAQFLALVEQCEKLLLQALQVFRGLFQGIHGGHYGLSGQKRQTAR